MMQKKLHFHIFKKFACMRFILHVVKFHRFDKCLVPYIHYYRTKQNSFTTLKIVCAVPINFSPFLLKFWQTLIFYCLWFCLFQIVIFFSFSNIHFFMVWWLISFYLWIISTVWMYQLIRSPVGGCIDCFQFGAVMSKICHKHSCEGFGLDVFPAQLVKYLGMRLLDHMIRLCL